MPYLLFFLLVFLQFVGSFSDDQAPMSVGIEAASSKLVFAHLIMGTLWNRQSSSDYDADMRLAKSIGIDAFALNIAKDPYTDTQLGYAYNSAQANGMKVFISFDCAYFQPGDEGTIGNKIAQYASYPAQLKIGDSGNLVFVSTFVGDSLNVAAIRSAARNPIYFAPNFHPGLGNFGPLDGAFSWAAWPSNGRNKAPTGPQDTVSVDSFDKSYISALGGTISRREVEGEHAEVGGVHAEALGVVDASLNWIPAARAFDEDANYTAAAADPTFNAAASSGKGYIAPVSPWFFTHYGGEVSYSKNWVFPSDLLIYLRWLEILALQPTFVELVTWNDYGESHYIGPLSSPHGDDGASKWVNDMPHLGWAYLSKPFISAYKASSTSVNPYITSDQIIYWYRIIPKSLNCDSTDTTSGGGNNASGDFFQGRPNGYQTLADNVFVVTFLTSPGNVTVNTGGALYAYNAPQGASAFSVPFRVGAQRFALERNGVEVMSGVSLKVIQNTCPCGLYNYNAYVGMVPDMGIRDVLQTGPAYAGFGNGLKVACGPSPSLPLTAPTTTAPSASVITMSFPATTMATAAPTSPPI
ncbi:hypothetical protein V5O48_009672 [Marasmius crinis-equi]|uniref:Glycoside hydrolase family 71 protein n=1 Tax=Marasmius crinis-equi TaxID=585013 RepID=A0ABR3FB65_9AGAR